MILKPSPGQNKKPQTPPYLHNDGDCHFLNYFGAFGSIPEIGIDQGTSSGNMPSIDCRQIIITSFQRWKIRIYTIYYMDIKTQAHFDRARLSLRCCRI